MITVDSTDDGAMTEVVRAAAGLARPGDTVLLAPAAASYDMFTGFAARGDAFAAAARAARAAGRRGHPRSTARPAQPGCGSARIPRRPAGQRFLDRPYASVQLLLLASVGLLGFGVLMAVSTTIAAARDNGGTGSIWNQAVKEVEFIVARPA